MNIAFGAVNISLVNKHVRYLVHQFLHLIAAVMAEEEPQSIDARNGIDHSRGFVEVNLDGTT